jgi:hypothetical protein
MFSRDFVRELRSAISVERSENESIPRAEVAMRCASNRKNRIKRESRRENETRL